MKLFLISQDENTNYDTYDSAVVAAIDIQTAKKIDPLTGKEINKWNKKYSSWCSSPDNVKAIYLGEADIGIEQGVICASFNAGC